MSLLFFLGLFIAGLMKHNLIIGSLPNYSSLCHVPGRDTRCARFSVGKPEVTSSPLRLWLCPSEGSWAVIPLQNPALHFVAGSCTSIVTVEKGVYAACMNFVYTVLLLAEFTCNSPGRVVMHPRFARCLEHHQRFVEASVFR